MIDNFICAWIYVSSTKKAREFYERVLGFSLVFEDKETGWVEFSINHSSTHLSCQEWGKTNESQSKEMDARDMIYQPKLVFSTKSLVTMREKLACRDVETSSIRKLKEISYINARDFDGNLIQIVEDATNV